MHENFRHIDLQHPAGNSQLPNTQLGLRAVLSDCLIPVVCFFLAPALYKAVLEIKLRSYVPRTAHQCIILGRVTSIHILFFFNI